MVSIEDMTPNDEVQLGQSINDGSLPIGSSLPDIAERLSKDAAEAEVALTIGEDSSAAGLNEKRDVLDEEEQEWGNDPENARNWPPHRKWATVFVVRAAAFHHFRVKT